MHRSNAPKYFALLAITLACGLPAALIAPAHAQPDREAQQGEDLLPVKRVTMYRSGVGAFERAGLIRGDQTVALRFETDQINDILKSMVLLDLDGGKVNAVGYGSQEPLDRRLASFAIDLSGNPSMISLLSQLRGAEVTLETVDGPIDGRIISTEEREVKAQDGSEAGDEFFVTVMRGSGAVISVRLSNIRYFRLQDENLQQELARALAALSENRADRTKSVELRFEGEPGRGRRIVVAYVIEMPVWKTSYRLVLDEGEVDPSIYGWAIVENTTDTDWENVTLALASGRPVSFTMDLYKPLFAPRPDVPVPFLAGIGPKMYESRSNRQPPAGRVRNGVLSRGGGGLGAEQVLEESDMALGGFQNEYMPAAQASAGFAGEQFMYTVDGPVTIERQRSAMLPILSTAIEGRRVSIYTPSSGQPSPMRGVELTNDTGLHLMPGPIAVYDAGSYTGDAQIPHTSRNQDRLLSYALDLPVRVDEKTSSTSNIISVKINDGMLIQLNKNVRTTTYTVDNSDDRRGRTLFIEHPRRSGWDVVSDADFEELSDVRRFEIEVGASDTEELAVTEEYVNSSRYELVNYDISRLQLLIRRGVASQDVLEAVRKAADFASRIAQTERRLGEIREELQSITRDQQRLRENIRTVREGSELYARYLQKLTEQEDRIETLEAEQQEMQEQLERLRNEQRTYLRNLDVS